jgi:hypothetical protein
MLYWLLSIAISLNFVVAENAGPLRAKLAELGACDFG